jgi:hypothetical protein
VSFCCEAHAVTATSHRTQMDASEARGTKPRTYALVSPSTGPGASSAPGSIGSAADKSGAGPKLQPPAFTSPSEKRPWHGPLECRG